MNIQRRQRVFYLDALQALFAFFVVIMHCTLTVYSYRETVDWCTGLILHSLSRSARAVFCMVCGAMLLNFNERMSTKEFLTRRCVKTVIPLIVWSAIYVAYNVFFRGLEITSATQVINMFTGAQVHDVFWFLYTIIALYLAIPFLAPIANRENMKPAKYLVLLLFLYITARRLLEKFTGIVIAPVFAVPLGMGWERYVVFMFWGWILYHSEIKKQYRTLIYCLGILGFALMVCGTWFLSSSQNAFDSFAIDNFSVSNIFMATALFTLFKHIDFSRIEGAATGRYITAVAKASMGIYLLHMLVIHQIELISLEYTMAYMFIAPIFVFAVCLLIVIPLSKVPVVRRLFP